MPTAERDVYLVIDDGPSAATPQLLEVLEARGHRATLFLVGEKIEEGADALVAALRRDFALANHSWSHPHFSALALATAREEILRTEERIASIHARAGVRRAGRWFRFPFLDDGGAQADAFQAMLRELAFDLPPQIAARAARGYVEPMRTPPRADWPSSLVTLDWAEPPEDAFRAHVRRAAPGDVIELHDNAATVARYLGPLCDELARLGLRGAVPWPDAP